MSITILPVEILDIITKDLTVRDFLALCSTCKALHDPNIRLDAGYWSHVTHEQFRLPNRPAVEGDGRKWQKLYRRLQTQTSVFTWGKSNRGCLGRQGHARCNPVPLPMNNIKELGIIADMQCGGWSTSFLTSRGLLYVAGVLDGMTAEYAVDGVVARLKYPASVPDPLRRENPNNSLVAIRQFSSGRNHILGLSDSGRIWTWKSHAEPALQVKFLHADTYEHRKVTAPGAVKQVMAGWNFSSAYVTGAGILLWGVHRGHTDPEVDTVVLDATAVPWTSYESARKSDRQTAWKTEDEEEIVGSVVTWVCLENYVVFLTDIGRIFASRVEWDNISIVVGNSFELRPLRSTNPYPTSCDVQGSFRSFGVFMNGSVAVLHQDWLDSYSHAQCAVPPSALIPALQQSGVQQLAFGDYHFHALHSDGTITSYGKEPSACGALGLGGGWNKPSRTIRGVLNNHDAELIPEARQTGRRVWFEPEKQKWLEFLSRGGADPDESKERREVLKTRGKGLVELSEWVERRGRNWDWFARGDDGDGDGEDEDGLGAYFALSVSAAGWSSGALVLVNSALTEKMAGRGSFWESERFPRLRLRDGTEMAGTIEVSEWTA
ncbi:RCC1/BLIP-II [Pseudovirgaria hyperparasitica]|uniref:RCC1/BLIP-II n=1 Tax=Pseudovirgaria hyperparasitica TaxID=470096 RepID=A0A6A6WKR8_9PEZI|nr:RCC1/BLIP-II [Pseudovirgaria hyperparasitica]KAF2762766.1 RCC1/BLIP-II [Pseudovirgaria hyperparasitica]